MSGQLWFMFGVGVLVGAVAERLIVWRRLSRSRASLDRALDRAYDEGYDECLAATETMDAHDDPATFVSAPVFDDLVASLDDAPLQVGHTIYPELAALAADDVPEPGSSDEGENVSAYGHRAGLGHPSPYHGPLTPAQRRRDKHKQRGTYQPGDMPDPPTDLDAWWRGELRDLLVAGQSDWLTTNLWNLEHAA